MAIPNAVEPRRFYRAAEHRFEEAQFLLDGGGYTTAAVYLAGYAVECIWPPRKGVRTNTSARSARN